MTFTDHEIAEHLKVIEDVSWSRRRPPVHLRDKLREGQRFIDRTIELFTVLANPPFGKKSSVTIVNEAGEQSKESLIINRDDCPLKRSRRVAKSKSRLRASRAAN